MRRSISAFSEHRLLAFAATSPEAAQPSETEVLEQNKEGEKNVNPTEKKDQAIFKAKQRIDQESSRLNLPYQGSKEAQEPVTKMTNDIQEKAKKAREKAQGADLTPENPS